MTSVEITAIVAAGVLGLAGMGTVAIAKKWLVFSLSVRVIPPAKPKPDTDATRNAPGIVPGLTEADTGPIPLRGTG